MSSSFSPADNLISFLMVAFINNRSLLFFNANSQTFELVDESKEKPVVFGMKCWRNSLFFTKQFSYGFSSFLLLAWLSFICSGALLWSCLSTFHDKYLQLYDLIKKDLYLWLAVPSHSCSSSSLPHPLLPLPLHRGSYQLFQTTELGCSSWSAAAFRQRLANLPHSCVWCEQKEQKEKQ